MDYSEEYLSLRLRVLEAEKEIANLRLRLYQTQHSGWLAASLLRRVQDDIRRAMHHLMNDEPGKATEALSAVNQMLED